MSKAKPAFTLSLILFFSSFIFPLSSFAQTDEETLTITTYYPAPYGVYNEMRAKRMAVGTDYYKYSWTCGGSEICNADLAVQGNVGIGTTSPGAKLHVRTTGGVGADFNQPILRLQDSSVPTYWDIYGSDGHAAPSSQFRISETTNGSTENWRLVIDQTGDVGIGTVEPSFSIGSGLHIKGVSPRPDAVIRLTESTSLLGNFEIRSTARGTSGNRLEIGEGSDIFLTIRSDDDGGATTSRGRVGIGTTNPGSKLAVAGEIAAGSGSDKTVFHKGNLILITCAYSWRVNSGGWTTHTWTSADCGSPPKLPSQYANSMRAISGRDLKVTYDGGDVWMAIYCNAANLRVHHPYAITVPAYDAYVSCDYLCWD